MRMVSLVTLQFISAIAFWISGYFCNEDNVKKQFNLGIQHEKTRAQAFRDSIRNACTYGNVVDTLYAVDRKAIDANFPKPNLKKMIGE